MTKNNIIDLPLSGMESEHCALIIDKGLSKVEGVDSHKVELNNHKVILEIEDPGTLGKAVHAIRDLGYDVPTIKKNFPVTGFELRILCYQCRNHFTIRNRCGKRGC